VETDSISAPIRRSRPFSNLIVLHYQSSSRYDRERLGGRSGTDPLEAFSHLTRRQGGAAS
jgi:hypothetical protein